MLWVWLFSVGNVRVVMLMFVLYVLQIKSYLKKKKHMQINLLILTQFLFCTVFIVFSLLVRESSGQMSSRVTMSSFGLTIVTFFYKDMEATSFLFYFFSFYSCLKKHHVFMRWLIGESADRLVCGFYLRKKWDFR